MSFVLALPRARALPGSLNQPHRSPGPRLAAGLLVALLTAVLSAGLMSASPAEAAVRTPPVPTGLPSGIEGMPAYVPAVSCEPAAKPGVLKLARLLVATYPATSYLTSRTCGTGLPTSEHYDGRAVDWMVSVRSTTQAAEASAVLGWLFGTDRAGHSDANLRRLGVMYVIWNNRIWGAWSRQWSAYSSCASHPESSWDTTCHRNHIHFSLSWEGARGATSFWSKRVAAPDYGPCRVRDLNWAAPRSTPNPVRCTSYLRVSAPAGASTLLKSLTLYSGLVSRQGDSGPAVSAIQRAVGVSADGSFGPGTAAAVLRWKARHPGLAPNATVGYGTWRTFLVAYAPR